MRIYEIINYSRVYTLKTTLNLGMRRSKENPSTDEFLITLLVPHLVQHFKHNFYEAQLFCRIYFSVVAINQPTNYKTFFLPSQLP